MSLNGISGKYINVKLAGIDVDVVSCETSIDKFVSEVTGSLSGGWREYIVGNRGMSITITGNIKRADPLDALDTTNAVTIPGTDDGEEIDFELSVDRAKSKGVRGKMIVSSVRLTGNAESSDKQQFVLTGMANGPVTQF